MLRANDLDFYRSQGYLTIPNFSSPSECSALRSHAAVLLAACDPSSGPGAIFNFAAKKHASDQYFTESTNKASFFFKEGSFSCDGRMIADKNQAIVKIGHALHDCDPVFQEFSHSSRMRDLARKLGYKRPLIGQSRYFFMRPGQPGAHIHQDSMALYTEPLSCQGLWLALEDATCANGCLWVLPGSHREGLRSRLVRDDATGEMRAEALGEFAPWDPASFIPLEVSAGTAVLLHGELTHKTNANASTRSREAFALHFIEGEASHKYPQRNWLQRPGGFGELRHNGVLEPRARR